LIVNGDFTADTTTLKVDSTNNRVGIGTTSPTHELTVDGDISLPTNGSVWIGGTGNGTDRLRLHHASSTGHAYIDYRDDLYFRADGAGGAVILDSAGQVGIGIDPTVVLQVNAGTDNVAILAGSTDATCRINMMDSNSTGQSYVGIGAVGDDLSLWAGNSKKMTIKSDGDVGIGTTSPDTNLEVVGSVRASTSFLVNSSGDDGIGPVTGTYGSVQTVGTGAGSYEGYSINGQQVFMGNGTEVCGIYNDVDNQWLLYFDADTYTRLYDSDGIVAFGANNATTTGGGSGGNGYVGISNECGGFGGTGVKISTTTVAGVTMKRLGFNTSSYESKTGIEDLSMSDEAFMSLKPITFHPNDQYVDLTGDVTEIPGGHTIIPDKTEAGNTAGLLPLKRAGFGLEDLYGRDDTMILATEFSPDDTALIAVLTLKLQETMVRVDALETA
jgi:hypothetical protein